MAKFSNRKRPRLPDYDYSQPGSYFITICTQNRIENLSKISTSSTFKTAGIVLSDIGKVVNNELQKLGTIYPSVSISAQVIMPNHVHFILDINNVNAPSVSNIIRLWKSAITKKLGFSLWQTSFHDHVIRNDTDYDRLLHYIENNPAQWELDSLNPKNS